MIDIPSDFLALYESMLKMKSVPDSLHNYYKKWLRYYIDFCKKYNHPYSKMDSLSHFIQKLNEKNHAEEQQKQAKDAINLYFELKNKKNSVLADKTKITTVKDQPKPNFNNASFSGTEGWNKAYDDLSAEIKSRHYSPKTLEAYMLWAKKFQGFTRNKDPMSLSSDDVKEYMKYLAVTKKVSASTQNQAFNALLFFYKHILKKDFGNRYGS